MVEDIKTKTREEIVVDSSDNLILNLGPNSAHAFQNIGGKEMVLLAFINEIFDKNDPDTYEYRVI